jgi:16S rRNA (cytidine1402-2'-O)-methyltransferase
VRAATEAGLKVECLPGATALIPAVVASGIPCDRFIFEGFLPQKKGRQKRLTSLANEERTIVFYESPHRLLKTLQQIAEFIGAYRKACVVREISKLHEEYHRGTILDLIDYFTKNEVRGEIVIVLEGQGRMRALDDETEEI